MRLKILQVNTVLSYGSTGSIVRNIYDGLIEDGHHCLVAYGRGNALEGYQSVSIATKIDTFIHYLGSRFFDLHGLCSRKSTNKLISIIEEYNPDIIHLHNIHGYYLNYRILFDYLSKVDIPVVWLMHDQWSISGGTAYSDDLLTKTKRSKEERKDYPRLSFVEQYKRNLRLKKESFTKLSNLTIVTPSNWLSDQLKSSFFCGYPIYTIHNGIDLGKFSPSDIRNDSQKKQILGVANIWDSRKGADYFLHLAEELDSTYNFTMIGIDKHLKSTISKLGLNIVALDKTSSIEELVDLYSSADIFLNPTLQDNFPTVNIEAQACGTPVITFDSGGSGESVLDGLTGRIVPQGSYKELKEAVVKWPPKNKQIQQICIENSKKYEKNVMYNEYLNLYHQLMEKKNGL